MSSVSCQRKTVASDQNWKWESMSFCFVLRMLQKQSLTLQFATIYFVQGMLGTRDGVQLANSWMSRITENMTLPALKTSGWHSCISFGHHADWTLNPSRWFFSIKATDSRKPFGIADVLWQETALISHPRSHSPYWFDDMPCTQCLVQRAPVCIRSLLDHAANRTHWQ